jgi:tRNA 2-thiouridine synthesizing protein D
MATITITLLSGAVENQNADFAIRLAEAALAKGHKANLFLIGNGCNLANQEIPWTGERGMNDALTAFMDQFRLADRLQNLAAKGAVIDTCHTTEYARGTEGSPYLEGVTRGTVGTSLTKFLITSDVAFTLG